MKLKRFNELNEESNWTPKKKNVDENTEEIVCEPNEMYCPYCGTEQDENPANLFSEEIHDQDCENCGENFYIDEVYYISCHK